MVAVARPSLRKSLAPAALVGAALVLAGAAEPPPLPSPPAPPRSPPLIMPPPVEAVPSRPLPPAGAVASMAIPARDAAGTLLTVNANLSSAQAIWNLRSALNVAALNCREPQYAAIVADYTAFLTAHAPRLKATDRALDAEFRRKHGAGARRARDLLTTQVYNYFALPPTLPGLCDAALAVGAEAARVAPGELAGFAVAAVPRLDRVFEAFFAAFEQYRIDAAAWDARYGTAPAFASSAGIPTVAGAGALILPRPMPAPARVDPPADDPLPAAPAGAVEPGEERRR